MILGVVFESFGNAFSDMVFESVYVTQRIAITGMLIFLIVQIGIAIIRFFTGSGESFPSFQKPLSYIVLFFFLLSYNPVMKTFTGVINRMDGYIKSLAETDYETIASDLILLKNIQNAPQLKAAGQDANALEQVWTDMQNSWEEMKASFKSTVEFFTFSFPALLFASIADGITGIVRYLIEVLSVLLSGVLIIIGPLAMMFQTAPFIGDGILKNWFTTWLSIKCWSITMSIIDMMMHKFLILFTSQQQDITDFFTQDLGQSQTWLIVVNVSFIVLFIATPMITSYYIKGSGGAMMSKMLAAATTVVNSAAGVASGGSSEVVTKAMKGMSSGINTQLASLNKQIADLKRG